MTFSARSLGCALALLLCQAWPASLSAQDDEEPPRAEGEGEEAATEEGSAEGEESSAEGEETPALEEEQAAVEREERGDEEEEAEEEPERESLHHEYQVGIRAGAGVPFVFALRYDTGPPCDAEEDYFCVLIGSGIVDVDLSFGVLPDLEITGMFRVGMVGIEPTGENTLLAGLGIRSYPSPNEIFKFFLGARLILDFTPPGTEVMGWDDVDFGVRGEVGIQLDFVRYFGLFIQVGVNVMFLRAFSVSPDVTGGFQIRFP